jgi:hypothetical protein
MGDECPPYKVLAVEFGCTKNAICGKANRLGYKFHPSEIVRRCRGRKTPRKVSAVARRRSIRRPVLARDLPPSNFDDPPETKYQCTLLELNGFHADGAGAAVG